MLSVGCSSASSQRALRLPPRHRLQDSPDDIIHLHSLRFRVESRHEAVSQHRQREGFDVVVAHDGETGLKLARPELRVVVISGDGDTIFSWSHKGSGALDVIPLSLRTPQQTDYFSRASIKE